MKFNLKEISKRISLIILGLGFALMIYNGFFGLRSEIYILTPMDEVYHQDVIVPNFTVGTDPVLQYSRRIGMDFTTIFDASLRDLNTNQSICRRSGSASFKQDEPQPAHPITLSRYMDQKCNVGAGQFYIEVDNIIKINNLPDRIYTAKSNVFTVTN